jgi:formylmethanofuran dehydrogenase subunit C
MSLRRFMDEAYRGKARSRRLETQKGNLILGLDDLADRVGAKPSKGDVEELAPSDPKLLARLISGSPDKKCLRIWGYLTSIAAERSSQPIRLPAGDFAGLELAKGTIILEKGGDHLGEGMAGGRILAEKEAGDYLGQGMTGGRIVAVSCGDYAFRRMGGGWGVVLGDAGDFLGLGNAGGRIAVGGSAGERAGWLMSGGRLRIKGDAGDYVGLLMKGGEIHVGGKAGSRAGWRMKGGCITASALGPDAGVDALGGSILRRDT